MTDQQFYDLSKAAGLEEARKQENFLRSREIFFNFVGPSKEIGKIVKAALENPLGNAELNVKFVFYVLKLKNPTPEVDNWFGVFREKLMENFIKSRNISEEFITQQVPLMFARDLCDEILILHILSALLAGESKKSQRMIFLSGIRDKVKSIFYARESIEKALEQRTISREFLEVHEIIKRECAA